MLSKTHSRPVYSPAPKVFPDTITGPVSNGHVMTGAGQVTRPVSAMRKARAVPSSLPEPAAITFLIYEDNSGGYHWAIVAGGETLVRSDSFGSCEEAEHAADIVRHGASQAAFEDRTAHPSPVELPVRRNAAAARDHSDAERWLDEGGSFNNRAVTR